MKDKGKITKKQAKEMVAIRGDGMVHTFYNPPIGLVGGDHSVESVFEDIDNSYMCKITGNQAQDTGHGLVIIPSKECKQSDLLFVETKPEAKK